MFSFTQDFVHIRFSFLTYDGHLHILASFLFFYYASILLFWIARISSVTDTQGLSSSAAAETAECGFTPTSALDVLSGVTTWLIIMVAFELELLFVIFLMTSESIWWVSEWILLTFAMLDVMILNFI